MVRCGHFSNKKNLATTHGKIKLLYTVSSSKEEEGRVVAAVSTPRCVLIHHKKQYQKLYSSGQM